MVAVSGLRTQCHRWRTSVSACQSVKSISAIVIGARSTTSSSTGVRSLRHKLMIRSRSGRKVWDTRFDELCPS